MASEARLDVARRAPSGDLTPARRHHEYFAIAGHGRARGMALASCPCPAARLGTGVVSPPPRVARRRMGRHASTQTRPLWACGSGHDAVAHALLEARGPTLPTFRANTPRFVGMPWRRAAAQTPCRRRRSARGVGKLRTHPSQRSSPLSIRLGARAASNPGAKGAAKGGRASRRRLRQGRRNGGGGGGGAARGGGQGGWRW